jgi:hypothetical protein
MKERRRKCCNCRKLTYNWQRINGSPWHCYDGCYSTTGMDRRTTTGEPLWLGGIAWPEGCK